MDPVRKNDLEKAKKVADKTKDKQLAKAIEVREQNKTIKKDE